MIFFGKHISHQTKDPERFDIIIFKFPDDESQLFIKRLIGLPGETVEIRDGKVYINGSDEPLDDSFVPEVPTGNYGPYTVPEDSYFMLGDNREYSRDSRFWKNTFVSFDEIVGKAIVTLLSIHQASEIRGIYMATWNSRGLRGSTLEDLVNRTNEQYAEKKLASDPEDSRHRSHQSAWTKKTGISHLLILNREVPSIISVLYRGFLSASMPKNAVLIHFH